VRLVSLAFLLSACATGEALPTGGAPDALTEKPMTPAEVVAEAVCTKGEACGRDFSDAELAWCIEQTAPGFARMGDDMDRAVDCAILISQEPCDKLWAGGISEVCDK
jgi:hypothetical protein